MTVGEGSNWQSISYWCKNFRP